jgi:hypothetical protein
MKDLDMCGVIIRNQILLIDPSGAISTAGKFETVIAYQATASDGATLSTKLVERIKQLDIIKSHTQESNHPTPVTSLYTALPNSESNHPWLKGLAFAESNVDLPTQLHPNSSGALYAYSALPTVSEIAFDCLSKSVARFKEFADATASFLNALGDMIVSNKKSYVFRMLSNLLELSL